MNFEQIKEFVVRAHWGQMYGSVPYIQHLEEVVDILKRSEEYPDKVIMAGYLHDVIEDTEVTFDLIKNKFGYDVATLVYAVTDEKINIDLDKLAKKYNNELGLKDDARRGYKDAKTYIRRQKKLKTYPKILSNEWAIHVKLADRIANVQHCLTSKDTYMIDMYRKESHEFQSRLRIGGIAEKLWEGYDYLITKNFKE